MGRRALPVTDPIALEYLTWCAQQSQARHTLRRRRAVLRAVGNPGTISREDLETWWASRTHLADSSRANDLALLHAFYRWCQIYEHRLDDPAARIPAPRIPTGAPRPVTQHELGLILDHVGQDRPMRRAVLLGAGAGLRIAETATLRWPDIDPATRLARVTGKGRKTRLVKLSTKLLDELLPDTGGNVVTGRMRGWAPDTLGRKVNAAIRAAGVPATYHKLRHRYGSLAYQREKDPAGLAELMGHASVATTMKFYAAAADDAADRIANAVAEW